MFPRLWLSEKGTTDEKMESLASSMYAVVEPMVKQDLSCQGRCHLREINVLSLVTIYKKLRKILTYDSFSDSSASFPLGKIISSMIPNSKAWSTPMK